MDRLQELQKTLDTQKIENYTFKLDVASKNDVLAVSEKIDRELKNIDILINNAAIHMACPFDKLDLEDFRNVMEVNLWGAVYCTKYFLPLLKKSEKGILVNILSGFGMMGFPNKITYCTSKAALRGFSNTLITELEKTNMKIIQVYPPAVDTGLVKDGRSWNEEKKEQEAAFLKDKGMDAGRVARKIVTGIEKGKSVIKIGTMVKLIDWSTRFAPSFVHRFIGKNQQKFRFI